MTTNADADLTLPSVVAAAPVDDCAQRLVLTIVFHPDTSRIGEVAQLPDLAAVPPWVVGRRSPAFAPVGAGPAAALEEPHISRQALVVTADGERLLLHRPAGSSRCRIGGRELDQHTALTAEELRRGVAILLGHCVVLLLRWAPSPQPAAATPDTGLRGSSVYMNALREQIARLGSSGLDVLVRGETGTGKELVATALHRTGPRGGPLVSINMAAIPPGLAAATLFGNVRGAFTGAASANAGFFGQAQGGTLFMDEIGDTPAEVQPQLLRALQEREVQAVGGAVRKVDVRVISATDAALDGEGCDFKAALRHRLGACEIYLLPLREHPEDIGELLLHFLTVSCRELGRTELLPGADAGAREIAAWAGLFHSCLRYRWPGNVRELANTASQVVVASTGGIAVPEPVRVALQAVNGDGGVSGPRARRATARRLRDIDEAEFDQALRQNGYEVANVARQLGVSRQAVYRRMDESARHRLAGQVPQAELEHALARREGDASAAARDLKVSLSSLRSRLRDSGLAWY